MEDDLKIKIYGSFKLRQPPLKKTSKMEIRTGSATTGQILSKLKTYA
jgi:hypothetical protein